MCTFHTFMVCNCVFYMKIAPESKESRAIILFGKCYLAELA